MRAVFRWALCAAMAPCVAGCASGSVASAAAAPPIAADANPVERVAAAMAQADEAANGTTVDTARLSQALAQLDAFGAKPASDNAGEDPAPAWSARLAAAGGSPPPLRGRALGPAYRNGVVKPGEAVVIEQIFLGGKSARVAVSAAGGQALALRVTDPAPRTMCQPAASARGTCTWLPLFTQRYAIALTNEGKVAVRYYLVVD